MVNATMAPPAFPVPGFQANMNQLQMLQAMQQQVQAQQLQTNCMQQNAFNFVNFAAASGGLNGSVVQNADALFNSFKAHRPTQLALPPSPSPSPAATATPLSAASTTPGHPLSTTMSTPRTLSFPLQGDMNVSCGVGGGSMTLINALSCLTAAHIRATRDVVSALQQCPELLAQPDFAFMRDFIREVQCVGVQQQANVNINVNGIATPSLVPLNEVAVAPLPMRSCAHLGVDTSMNDDACSPNSQMDVDINALLQALDINDVEFSASTSTSSTDISTPITPQSTASAVPMLGFMPQPMTQPSRAGVTPAATQNVQTVPGLTRVNSQVSSQQPVGPTTPTTNVSATPQQTTEDGMTDADREKAIIDPRKYKTRMCRNWLREGRCSYEHTCCFAHGEGELRNAAANITVLSSLGYFTSKQQAEGQQQPTTPTTTGSNSAVGSQQVQAPAMPQQGQPQRRRQEGERRA